MIRSRLLALTLVAACGTAKPPPPKGTDLDVDTDRPQPAAGGDTVAGWAGKMSPRVQLIQARDLPPAVVKALLALLPPPEALAPNRLLWARPLADGAGLVAFAAERGSGGTARDVVDIHALASTADGGFTLVASAEEQRTGAEGPARELAARDLDGDGVLDLIVDRDLRRGDAGQRGLAVFHSGSHAIALAIYAESVDDVVVTPQYVCTGPIGDARAVVVVTRSAVPADGSVLADRFAAAWLPDDRGRYRPTRVWARVLSSAGDDAALDGAWRKAAGNGAPRDTPVDEEGRLTAVADCGSTTALIAGNALRDADGKRPPGRYQLIEGLTADKAAGAAAAGGRVLVRLDPPHVD
ncbi:MAG TPA: hypothetical protein VL172_23030 [Kofleriaceae bacterium]|nr:hypothetical protein [Kofleriaceae bacterium]